MASPQDSGGPDGVPSGDRQYKKEYSLYLSVGDNQAVKARDIIREVTKLIGKGKMYACVPKAGNMYVLTFADKTVADLVSDGVQCGGKVYECKAVKKDQMNISFLNVDPYVPDREIVSKLESMNIRLTGDVRRVKYEDTEVENGNRVCRVRLPPNFVSLPYLMKLSDGESTGMYRVVHDNQKKLCHNCHQEGHIFRDCPEFICFKCSQQGHFKRQCTAVWCTRCFKYNCEIDHTSQNDNNDDEKVENVSELETSDNDEEDDTDYAADDCEECYDCGRDMCVCTDKPTKEKPKTTETIFGDFIDMSKNETPVEDPTNRKENKQPRSPEPETQINDPKQKGVKSDSHIGKPTDKTRENSAMINEKKRPTARDEEKMDSETSTSKRKTDNSPEPTRNKAKEEKSKKKNK